LALGTSLALLCAVSSAQAAVVLGVGPNIPSPNGPVAVGQAGLAASLTITNISDQAQGPLTVTVNPGTITLVPSCGTIPGTADCPAASVDPGVFRLSTTGTGATGTACANTVFTITKVDATQDKYSFTSTAAIVLGSGDTGGQLARCTINFTVDVLRAPTKDARPEAGIQTDELAGVNATASDNQTGSGFGSNFTTIAPATPTVVTAVAPPSIVTGQSFTDTATLVGSGGSPPTGTVDFTVYGPGDPTCAGTPSFTSVGSPVSTTAGVTTATSLPFTPTVAGSYNVVAHYSGDPSYVAVTTPCGAPNETEAVGVRPIPSLSVTKTPTPASLPAPGGPFQFTVVVTNTSNEALTLTSLTDNVYGNLSGKGSCALGATLAASGGTYTCAFTGNFTGAAGASQTDTVTPVGTDSLGQTATSTAQATVTLTPTPATPTPSLAVTKIPSPTSLPAPGGNFSFTVTVTNTSTEALTLTSLTDNVYGNLSGKGTCKTGGSIPAGGMYKCTFTGAFHGSAGASQTDTVTPIGTDSAGRTATSTARATVKLTPTPGPLVAATRLSGPPSCIEGPFKTTVTGSGIKRVTFYLNGKKVGSTTKADSSGRFRLTIKPTKTATLRVTAKVEYKSTKFGHTKTLTRSFGICQAPRFTG
jgi:hypothetical protein